MLEMFTVCAHGGCTCDAGAAETSSSRSSRPFKDLGLGHCLYCIAINEDPWRQV